MRPQFLIMTLILFFILIFSNLNNVYCKNLKINSLVKFLTENRIKSEQIIMILNWTDFEEKILSKNSSYFVCFYKGDSQLSKEFTDVLKEELSNHLNTKVAFVDVNLNSDIAKNYQINFTPILSFFRNGEMLGNKVHSNKKDFI